MARSKLEVVATRMLTDVWPLSFSADVSKWAISTSLSAPNVPKDLETVDLDAGEASESPSAGITCSAP